MTDEEYFRTNIEKSVSNTLTVETMVSSSLSMMTYLNHKFALQKTHCIENIELDSFRVDISIVKRSSSKYLISVYENKFLRELVADPEECPNKYYKVVSSSVQDVVLKLIVFLHTMRYDKRSNTFETVLGTAEVDFLTTCLPEGTLDYLKCSVCLEYYNNHTEIFACTHTLCMPCQQKFVRSKLSCPLCRAEFGSPVEENFDYDDESSSSEDSYHEEEEEDEEYEVDDDFSFQLEIRGEEESSLPDVEERIFCSSGVEDENDI
jgi:hypothetical protein